MGAHRRELTHPLWLTQWGVPSYFLTLGLLCTSMLAQSARPGVEKTVLSLKCALEALEDNLSLVGGAAIQWVPECSLWPHHQGKLPNENDLPACFTPGHCPTPPFPWSPSRHLWLDEESPLCRWRSTKPGPKRTKARVLCGWGRKALWLPETLLHRLIHMSRQPNNSQGDTSKNTTPLRGTHTEARHTHKCTKRSYIITWTWGIYANKRNPGT